MRRPASVRVRGLPHDRVRCGRFAARHAPPACVSASCNAFIWVDCQSWNDAAAGVSVSVISVTGMPAFLAASTWAWTSGVEFWLLNTYTLSFLPAISASMVALSAAGHDVELRVLGNKITDEHDVAYLRAELGTVLLGCLTQSAWVRAAERGRTAPVDELETGNLSALGAVRAALDARRRDWSTYHRGTVEFHHRNAIAWANQSHGTDLMTQVDPDYTPGR